MNFEELKLVEPVASAVREMGYVTATKVQEQSIPIILDGKDILACAQTGTGKTAAFAIPIIQRMIVAEEEGRVKGQALILCPTRELATQTAQAIFKYTKGSTLKHVAIFGGVSQKGQTDALRKKVDLIVATPGRLMDLIRQRKLKLGNIKYLVLDEADTMLDMGFIDDITEIVSMLSEHRQSMLFSATMPKEILSFAHAVLKDPLTVQIDAPSSTASTISQKVYQVKRDDKRSLLIHMLQDSEIPSMLVFTRTKQGADRVTEDLNLAGISADSIHGNKSQAAREKALRKFRNQKTRVLVATDVAARGIDVAHLSHVVNYELPEVPEVYVHRIGRTGRAGALGTAISFCDPGERRMLESISRLISVSIPVEEDHPFHVHFQSRPQNGQGRGFGGKGKSFGGGGRKFGNGNSRGFGNKPKQGNRTWKSKNAR